MRTTYIAGFTLLVIIGGGCAKKGEKEEEPVVPVQLAPVRVEPMERLIRGDGIMRALDQSAVMPKISAPVVKFLVNRGDRVKQGQLVAVLENRDLRAAVTDAKGAYEQAAAQFRNVSAATVPDEVVKAQADVDASKQAMSAAQRVLESRQQLVKQGALARRLADEAGVAYAQAKGQYDTAQKHLESLHSVARHEEVKAAEGQMQSAKGKYEAAEANLAYSEVHSPISGIVADRPLFPGEMANPGSPLMTIVDSSSVIARVNLPPALASFVRVGNPATITATDTEAKLNGKVTVVSPAVDPQSTTVEVWVQAANPKGELRPGTSAHVVISAGRIPNATVVPASAILPSGEGGTKVLVVGKDMVAHSRQVETGVRTDELAQVVSGVKTGDLVVTEGGVGVEDGAKLKLAEAGDKKDAGKDEKEDDKKDDKKDDHE
jgi:multidrug efflux pump subunit AcrA (membrane-fusion protein)